MQFNSVKKKMTNDVERQHNTVINSGVVDIIRTAYFSYSFFSFFSLCVVMCTVISLSFCLRWPALMGYLPVLAACHTFCCLPVIGLANKD